MLVMGQWRGQLGVREGVAGDVFVGIVVVVAVVILIVTVVAGCGSVY